MNYFTSSIDKETYWNPNQTKNIHTMMGLRCFSFRLPITNSIDQDEDEESIGKRNW